MSSAQAKDRANGTSPPNSEPKPEDKLLHDPTTEGILQLPKDNLNDVSRELASTERIRQITTTTEQKSPATLDSPDSPDIDTSKLELVTTPRGSRRWVKPVSPRFSPRNSIKLERWENRKKKRNEKKRSKLGKKLHTKLQKKRYLFDAIRIDGTEDDDDLEENSELRGSDAVWEGGDVASFRTDRATLRSEPSPAPRSQAPMSPPPGDVGEQAKASSTPGTPDLHLREDGSGGSHGNEGGTKPVLMNRETPPEEFQLRFQRHLETQGSDGTPALCGDI